MRILIISGGSLNEEFAKDFLKLREGGRAYDRRIAADSGLDSYEKLGILPTDVLGDFDSLKNRELLEKCQNEDIGIRTYPVRKDYTDTHIALKFAMELIEQDRKARGTSEEEYGEDLVELLGATGTRLDHTMANIGLLSKMAEHGIIAKIYDANNQISFWHGPKTLTIEREEDFKYISLIPCSREVTGITLKGFSFPLEDASLGRYESMGISNEIVDPRAQLSFDSGELLLIRSRD
ncbi:MAG: thiamine diphosphokinase [Lachnospiraceae bacterium]|nr:thiamine diphosphokinase [Lachnospiraceae bacterium]